MKEHSCIINTLWSSIYTRYGIDHTNGATWSFSISGTGAGVSDPVLGIYKDGALVPSLQVDEYPCDLSFVIGNSSDDVTDLSGFSDATFQTSFTDVMFGPVTHSEPLFEGSKTLDLGCNLVRFPIEYDPAWIGYDSSAGQSLQEFLEASGGIANAGTGDFLLTYASAPSGSQSSPVESYVDASVYHLGEDEVTVSGDRLRTWFAVLVPTSSVSSDSIDFHLKADFGGSVGVQTSSVTLSDPRLSTPGQELTFFAKPLYWQISYEDRESSGLDLPSNASVLQGDPLTADMVPSRSKDGFTFLGWFVDGGDVRADTSYTPTQDIVLVPKLTVKRYSIAYTDPDNTGVQLPSDNDVDAGFLLTDAELPDRADPSYQFHGWYVLGTDTKLEVGDPVDSDLSVQPKATKNYLVSYSGIDQSVTGLDDLSPFYVIPGEPLPADKTPSLSKVAYRFEGWSANDLPVMADGTYVPSQGTVLTARFVTLTGIPSEMTIRYNTQVDAWVADSPVELSGKEPSRFSTLPLRLVPIARKGFSQIGWVMTFSGTDVLQDKGHSFVARKEIPLSMLVEQDFTLTPGCYTATPETTSLDNTPVSGYIPSASVELMPLYRRDSILVQPPVVFPTLDYCDAETPLGVLLTSDTPGARIYYTLDDSDPADIEEDNPAYNPDGSTPDELPRRIKDSAVSVPSGTRVAITCSDRDQVRLRAVAYLPWQVPSGESWGLYTPKETEFLLDLDGGSFSSEVVRHISGLEPYGNITPPYKHAHRFLGLFGAKTPPLLADDVQYWDELGHPVAGVPLSFGQTPTLFARWEATGDCDCHNCTIKALQDLVKKNKYTLVMVSNVTTNENDIGVLRYIESVGVDVAGDMVRNRYMLDDLPCEMYLSSNNTNVIFAATGSGGGRFYSGIYDSETETLSLSTYLGLDDTNYGLFTETFVDGLNSQIKTKDSTISGLNSQIKTKDSTISSLNSQIKTKDSTISSLNSQIKTKDSTISSLNSQIKTKDSTISSLNLIARSVERFLWESLGETSPGTTRNKKVVIGVQAATPYTDSSKTVSNLNNRYMFLLCYRVASPSHDLGFPLCVPLQLTSIISYKLYSFYTGDITFPHLPKYPNFECGTFLIVPKTYAAGSRYAAYSAILNEIYDFTSGSSVTYSFEVSDNIAFPVS